MKLKKLCAVTLAAGMTLTMVGCSDIPKSDKPLGVYITYGDQDQFYGFVDPENETVFMADLPKDVIDKNGDQLDFEDLESGDVLEMHGKFVTTNSLPPIYSGVTKMVRIKEGGDKLEKKYEKIVKDMLDVTPDESEIPMVALETLNDSGFVTTSVNAASFDWSYKNEKGKEEHTVSSEANDIDPVIVNLDKSEVDANMYLNSTPKKLEIKCVSSKGEEIVDVQKETDSYKMKLSPDAEYTISGEWDNGKVVYKFQTKTAEEAETPVVE